METLGCIPCWARLKGLCLLVGLPACLPKNLFWNMCLHSLGLFDPLAHPHIILCFCTFSLTVGNPVERKIKRAPGKNILSGCCSSFSASDSQHSTHSTQHTVHFSWVNLLLLILPPPKVPVSQGVGAGSLGRQVHNIMALLSRSSILFGCSQIIFQRMFWQS